MADIPDEERCVAIKRSDGERCTRMAKDGEFCFQHNSSFDTVNTPTQDSSDNVVEIVANKIDISGSSFSGVQQDVAQNISNILDEAGSVSAALRSGDLSEIRDAFPNTVEKTGPTTGAGALIGGVAGSPFGPIGIATGATVGGWFGVYKGIEDDRAVAASVADEVPSDADVVSSQTEAIRDVEPIQMAINSAQDTQNRTEWLRSTFTRERDMDEVKQALSELPEYQGENNQRQYYFRDDETGEILLVIFGIPDKDR